MSEFTVTVTGHKPVKVVLNNDFSYKDWRNFRTESLADANELGAIYEQQDAAKKADDENELARLQLQGLRKKTELDTNSDNYLAKIISTVDGKPFEEWIDSGAPMNLFNEVKDQALNFIQGGKKKQGATASSERRKKAGI